TALNLTLGSWWSAAAAAVIADSSRWPARSWSSLARRGPTHTAAGDPRRAARRHLAAAQGLRFDPVAAGVSGPAAWWTLRGFNWPCLGLRAWGLGGLVPRPMACWLASGCGTGHAQLVAAGPARLRWQPPAHASGDGVHS